MPEIKTSPSELDVAVSVSQILARVVRVVTGALRRGEKLPFKRRRTLINIPAIFEKLILDPVGEKWDNNEQKVQNLCVF